MANNEQSSKLDILDIKQFENNFGSLKAALNRATLKGAYELDEAVVIKQSLDNLIRAVEQLDKCQRIIVKHVEEQQKKGKGKPSVSSSPVEQ